MNNQNFDVTVSAGAFLLLALLLVLLPLPWIAAAITAAAFHELCHIAAILIWGGRIEKIEISGLGAKIITYPLPCSRQLICALAGPLGSALLILLYRYTPRIAICGAVHCIYNLIPLFPLDGGRAFRCLAAILLKPKSADRLVAWTEGAVLIFLSFLGVYAAIRLGMGIFSLLWVVILWKRAKESKKSCKQSSMRLQ